MNSSIFDIFQLMAQNVWLYGGTFVLVLSILVFVHEWGHYIVARKCGVKVESFSIGFGREIFGFTDKKGTRWKFSLIPLGGYVKLFGDTDPTSARHSTGTKDGETGQIKPHTAEERKVAFYAQHVAKRSAIVIAGPAINFIFAILILAGLYAFYGQPVTPPMVAAVMQGSAAEKAGFLPHDEVLSVDGKEVRRFEDIRREVMVGLDEDRSFRVKRGDVIVTIMAKPERKTEKDRFGFTHTRGFLGLVSVGNALQIDSIAKIDDREVKDADQARALLLDRMEKGQITTIEIDGSRDDGRLIAQPLAKNNTGLKDPESKEYGRLVISQSDDEIFIKHNAVKAIVEAMHETGNISINTLEALWQMITGTRSATELGGIIRIGAMAGDMAQAGILALITFTALLSINLGLINLFPIPMLDGGHLLFYLIEAVKGSPISEQIQEYAFRLGFTVLVGLMLFANINDLWQLIRS